MVSSVAGFGENLLTLGELQVRSDRKGAGAELSDGQDRRHNRPRWLPRCRRQRTDRAFGIAELLVSELAMKRGYALLGVGRRGHSDWWLFGGFRCDPGSAGNGSASPSLGKN